MATRDVPQEKTELRLFASVMMESSVIPHLVALQQELQAELPGHYIWSRPQNLHLTLKFLGTTPQGKLEAVKEALDFVADNCPCFTLAIEGVGAFPTLEDPKFIWAGLKVDGDVLQQLWRDLNLSLEPLGFKAEPDYHPHITLAKRAKEMPDLRDQAQTEKVLHSFAGRTFGHFKVAQLDLVLSEPDQRGSHYRVLARSQLR